ncbi:MAG: adenosine deaminase family protein [Alphaproteobacteria bacterium]|jgi:adenosine deaminase
MTTSTHLLGALAGLLFLSACQVAPVPEQAARQDMATLFEALKDSPPELEAFLRAMPKGGDLHNHAVGSIYAENFIAWAAEDGLCVDTTRLVLLDCDGNGKPLADLCEADALPTDQCHRPHDVVLVSETLDNSTFYNRLIDGLSVRNYELYPRSGHDQFFATFDAFEAAGLAREGDMLAEIMRRAGQQNILYLELMTSPGMPEAMGLGAALSWDENLQTMRDRISGADLAALVADTSHALDERERDARTLLACGTAHADSGCDVTVRYLAQVIRVLPAPMVFSQVVFGFALAQADSRVVGINLVAPEDDPVTLRDYTKQMQAVGFVGAQAPNVGIALHAGELTLGLVPPEDLRFHIWQAVEIAGADRIGHGVDVMYEDNPYALLATLAERDILIEINLTSNDVILGVEGKNHPLPVYMAAGVPVALSTDDEGVSRIDLTHEYQRAVQTFGFSYAEIKQLSYNSLTYAFTEERDALLAELDRRFTAFEAMWADNAL